MSKNAENNFIIFLFSIIPISIIVGQAVSLINILLISIFLFIQIFRAKNFEFRNSVPIILLLIIYIYLIFNTFISIDYTLSFFRNFGFLRFIFFFVAINFLFSNYKNQNLIFKIWSIVILIVIFDSYLEYFLGKNILGYGQDIYKDRIVSFFKDEPIVAAYLNGFFFLIIGFLFNLNKANSKIFIISFVLIILFLTCIIITGERSNTIKALFALFIFFLLNNKFNIKLRLLTFLSLIILFFFIK